MRSPSFHRSILYVSGSQPHRIDRAYDAGADAVVIDLEDSVPSAQKPLARETAAAYTSRPAPPVPTYVRVNSVRSGRCEGDVRAVLGPGLAGIRLAKTETPEEVRAVASVIAASGHPARVHVLVESARGVECARALAEAAPEVTMVGLGEYDLRAELGCGLESATMDACRVAVVLASRAAGIPSPCQGVYPEVYDDVRLLASSLHGKDLGFTGRMAIHPRQLPIIHDVYTPKADEIAAAIEVCEAADLSAERDSSIVYTRTGHMVAPPLVAAARQVVAIAAALELTPSTGRPDAVGAEETT